jgi:hypothetical protein
MNTPNITPMRTAWWTRITSLLAFMALLGPAFAQTFHIDATNGGNFDLGPTFGANNWNMSSGANNPWVIGTLPAGAPFAGNSAYPSQTNDPLNWTYNIATPCVNYMWRDVTVGSSQSVISLTFNWQGQGENTGWDVVQVFTAPTSVLPVGQITHPGSGAAVIPPSIAGATQVFQSTQGTVGVQTATVSLSPALAGTTFRLIFSWKSDTSVGTQPPVAVDNIVLTSDFPATFFSSAQGGLWNSPASWAGGVVPPGGNDIVIVPGATMVVNQSLSYGNVQIDGKVQWITTTAPSNTVNTFTASNINITPTGQLLAHAGTNAGAWVFCGGNFDNFGFAHFAATGAVLNMNAPSGASVLQNFGTFLADKQGRGMFTNLFFNTLGSASILSAQPLVTANLAHTAGSLETNGQLAIDNHAMSNGALLNRSVQTITVNAPGTGYNTATPPTVTIAAPPAGGTTATAVANIDNVTGTIRSITITNAGDGYRIQNPLVTIAGGTGSGATAIAHVYTNYTMGTASQTQLSAVATFLNPTLSINNGQGIAVAVTNGGTGYVSAPTVGVSLPTGFLNLVTAGGSGYTIAPTVTFNAPPGGTAATATAVVTRGQVTSINITGGGSNYTAANPPVISFAGGGGGTGAAASFPLSNLPQFTAVINAGLGQLVHITTDNPGFGYLTALPTITLTGGGGTGATTVARIGVYNMIRNFFLPATTNPQHQDNAATPANRRIHALTLANAIGTGMAFSGPITLYALAPLPTFSGPINMGGNLLAFDHPTYLGTAGNAAAYVENGSISYRFFGNTLATTRPFPFNSFDVTGGVNNLFNMGTATTVATEGSTITSITGSYVPVAVVPLPGRAGTRVLRIQRNGLLGNLPSLRLTFNSIDALGAQADQPNLFIAQDAVAAGPYTIRSAATGVGALPATGNRSTATIAPGPINDDEYFGWYSTLQPCVGDPAPGNTLSTTINACPSANFTLSLQNIIAGTGVNYQWESADDLAFTVNPALLGTGLTQVTNQTTAKYYRCLVTCTFSSESEYSTPILVNMGGACFCGAYCVVTNSGTGCITNVTFNAVNNTTPGCSPGNVSLQGATTTVEKGLTYPFSMTTDASDITSVWFDWNGDATFAASEHFQVYTTGLSGTVNVPVPLTAITGEIRMRVRSRLELNANGPGDACLAMGSGETEDYCITVQPATPCSGAPAANTALSTLANACTGTNFTLSLQNPVVPGGSITYQWQSADDLAFTTNVQNLGTGTTQVASLTGASQYYRCQIICGEPGGLTTDSSPVLVNLISDQCVCGTYPIPTSPSSPADTELLNVQIGSINNASTCAVIAPGAGSILNRYGNYAGSVPATAHGQGTSVPFNLTRGSCTSQFGSGFQIYVDWNQDGDWLELDEQVFSSAVTTTIVPEIGSFNVPLTATLGLTRMRVVYGEITFPSTLNYAQVAAFTWGEIEDYCFIVEPPPSPAVAIATINDNCIAGTYTIGINIANFGSGTPGDIVYSVNGGPNVNVPAVLGANTIPTVGSFLQSDVVSVSVTNNTISTLNMGNFYGGCPIIITCDTPPTEINHCYGNNDPRVFIFIASDPLRTLTMTFIAGTMEPNDIIRFYAGTDEDNSPSIVSGSYSDLGAPQLIVTSPNDTIMMVIDSDGSNSCQDTQQTTWQFEVICTQPCVNSAGTATFDLCTSSIDVSLDFDGGTSTAIGYIVNTNDTVFITGLNAPWLENLGPFNIGDVVKVLLVNEEDDNCIANLGTTTIVAPAGQPIVVASATPTTICANGSSTLSAIASGGTGPVNTYAFQTETGGTMADMTGATVLLGLGFDDAASTPITPMGFTFPYGTSSFTGFFASSNGQMNLGGATGNASLTNDLANGTPRPLITCWWDDLHTGSDGYVQTKLFGSPGSYIRVVEWKVRDYPGAGLPTTMLMQAWLYESGVIELRYGPATAVSDGGGSIGIGGAAGVFQSVTSPAHTVSTVTENTGNNVWPGDGRIYRWLLPEVPGTVYTWNPGNLSGGTVLATGIASTTVFTVSAVVPGGCPEEAQVTVTVEDPITLASITPNPANFCTGGSVLLTATPSDGVPPFTYAWTGPGGPAGSAQTQSANLAGLWTCLVTDACSVGYLASVTVNSSITPVLNITATAPICVGGDVTLTANVTVGSVSSYLWGGAAPVGGTTTSTATITSLTLANNGVYTVVGSDNGCNSLPASYTLSVNPTPVLSIPTATPNPICEGANSVLNVNASLPSSAYCAPGSGCTFPDIIDNVTFAGINRSSACDGPGVNFFTTPSAAVVAGTSYTLSVNTSGDVEGVAVWIDYDRNGSFDAPELVLNGYLATNPANYSALVNIPLTAFNGTTRMRVRCQFAGNPATNGTGPCGTVTFGETEDYNVVITGGATQLSYLWSGGPLLGGINNTASVTAEAPLDGTQYNVLVTSGTGCTNTGNVTVNTYPVPVVTCGGPYPTLCVAAADFQLTGSPSGGTWSGTGVTGGGLFDPSVGTQLLTYTFPYGVGCSTSCTVTVDVNSDDTDNDNIPDCVDECPLLFGEIGDACDAGPGFILGQIDGDCNCIGVACTEDVRLQVRTDANGFETSFQIREFLTNLVVCSGNFTGLDNADITQDCCLPEGCYNLEVTDGGGDGIVGGGYVLREANGSQRRVIDNTGNFSSGGSSQISDSPGFCVPIGDDRLIYTSCDKLDWKVSPCGGEFVVATANADVSAEYGVNNANSGYQMWWYAPNGGYSFKRFQSHNTANGLPNNAVRAAHFQINAWLGNQLQQNVLYNVKVRGRVNGDYETWGQACRFMVNDVLAQCPRTKLMDLPGNEFLSCGQSRAIGTNIRVHARPVRRMNANCNWVNANRYQFRFRLPTENVVILKTSATGQYFVNTNGLACGKTYEVDVRVSFNNGSTWCVVTPNPNGVTDPLWGDMCLLTTTCSFGMAQEGSGTSADESRVAMYPNPNRGDQLMLNVSSVEEGVETVTVDIFDAYGKRAIARTIAVQDGFVNTVLDLNGSLANGLYMVSITAGSQSYNERLVIQK